jgi:hypothetical protein
MRESHGLLTQARRLSLRITAAATLGVFALGTAAGSPVASALSKQPTDVVVAKLTAACEVVTQEGDANQLDDGEDLSAVVRYLRLTITQAKKYDRTIVAIRPAIPAQSAAITQLHKFVLVNISELTKLVAVAVKGNAVRFAVQAETVAGRIAAPKARALDALNIAALPVCATVFDDGSEEDPASNTLPTVRPALLPTAIPGYVFADPTASESSQVQALSPTIGVAYSGITLTRMQDLNKTYVATVVAVEFLPSLDEETRRRVLNVGAASLDASKSDAVNGFDVRVGGPVRGPDGPVVKVLAARGPLFLEFTFPAGPNDRATLVAAATAYMQAVPAAPPITSTPAQPGPV